MRRIAGVTLLELLVAAAIVAMMTAATTRALVVGFKTNTTVQNEREEHNARVIFEDKLENLIRRAWLAPAVAETDCFFVGQVGPMTPGDTTVPAAGSTGSSTAPTSSSPSGSSNGLTNSGNSDNLIFTSAGSRVPQRVIESTDDWETNNQNFGPVGGIAEVCLTMTPEDDPGSHQGLYIRTQQPADTDPTQGGFEQVLNKDVSAIGFEFYDGTQWDPTWDTRSMTPRRMPSAVRVTYRFNDDKTDHVFVVFLPFSDVTAANPVTQ